MPKSSVSVVPSDLTGSSRAGELIDAFLTEIARSGVDGVSARAVAARAGVSPSAINYHFGSMERLYGLAQDQALRQSRLWLDARLDQVVAGAPWPVEAFPAFAASLIDDWCDECRVQAYAEASDVISRIGSGSASTVSWLKMWDDVWTDVLPLFSLPAELSVAATPILQSERLAHLARWCAPHDRAGLEEVCVRLTARLSGDAGLLSRPTPWRLGAERLTLEEAAFPPLVEGVVGIAEAVVAAVDEGGEGALTHRSAAAKAGVSLGAVTHHFPTRSALMSAGYARLYQRLAEGTDRTGNLVAGHGGLGERMSALLEMGRQAKGAKAFEIFFLAATRDPALATFAARVRYGRGLNSLRLLTPIAPRLTRVDSLLLSHWLSGLGRTAAALGRGEPVDEPIRRLAARLFLD